MVAVSKDPKDADTVSAVKHSFGNRKDGYEIELNTTVVRVQDDASIAEGKHKVWIPGYVHI